ncbi:MAG: TolC family protein [Pseudomonadota bacterium]|nr:TolC family protein [Pseudomonadota bacterium]
MFTAVVCLITSGVVIAQSSAALSFEEARRLAVENAPLVGAAAAQAQAAAELAVSAAQLPDPVIRAGVENLPVNGPDRFSLTRDFMTMRSVGLMQEFPRAEKREARAERQRKDAELARAQGALAAAAARRDVALAWFDRFYQESLRDLWSEQLEETGLQVDASQTNYRVNRGTQADVFVARGQVELVRDRINQVERQVQAANARLARWIPDAGARALGAKPTIDVVPLHPDHLATELEQHPQIVIWDRQIALAEAEADVARTSRKSDWTGELTYSQRGPAYSNMVSINVSIPLQWDRANRQDREIAAKIAQVEQVRAQREDSLRMHVVEVSTMLQEWQSARERRMRYDEMLIPLAKERTRGALTAYRSGSAPFAPLLEARRNEIDVRIESLRLDMEAAKAWAELTYFSDASPLNGGRP